MPRRFQEDRIHVDHRLKASSLSLGHLRPSHFQPLFGHIGIQRHILRLEWHDTASLAVKDAAECRRQDAFADMRARSHEHDGFGHKKVPL